MNMPIDTNAKNRTHPMLIAAGATVVLFCATGTAALMGWIPSSMGRTQDPVPVAATSTAMPLAQGQYAAPRAAQHVAYAPVAHVHHTEARHYAAADTVCGNCGVVESMRDVSVRKDGSGLGAAGGALVGGLLGNQVGGGHGREAMTVAGAIGGALAGNQIEKRVEATHSYETTIRMDNGTSRSMSQVTEPQWRSGDHVKVVNGVVRMEG
jgi:outer membrane lipoprotein SlyB